MWRLFSPRREFAPSGRPRLQGAHASVCAPGFRVSPPVSPSSMSAFLGAAGHAEDRVNVVERHHPLEEKAFSEVFAFRRGKPRSSKVYAVHRYKKKPHRLTDCLHEGVSEASFQSANMRIRRRVGWKKQNPVPVGCVLVRERRVRRSLVSSLTASGAGRGECNFHGFRQKDESISLHGTTPPIPPPPIHVEAGKHTHVLPVEWQRGNRNLPRLGFVQKVRHELRGGSNLGSVHFL